MTEQQIVIMETLKRNLKEIETIRNDNESKANIGKMESEVKISMVESKLRECENLMREYKLIDQYEEATKPRSRFERVEKGGFKSGDY